MRSIYGIILLLVLLNSFTSCEKVIEVDIRDSEMKYVIEAVITDEPGVCNLRLSKTVHFNDPDNFPQVSGAVVKVKDNGVEHSLSELSPGYYSTNTINGTPGHTYDLSVSVDGKLFTATCVMQQPVTLDTLYIG